MSDAILVVNAGSSSIKFSVFVMQDGDSVAVQDQALNLLLGGQLEGLYTAPRFVAKDAAGAAITEQRWPAGEALGHAGAVAHLGDFLRTQLAGHRLAAVGHRVVHGGLEYSAPERMNATIVEHLERFVPLAPLHQPHNLAPIRALLASRPELPQVACFDTAFQQSGLLGISGISSDMRTLLASVEPRAQFAVAQFVYRISRELGSLAAALGGLDALVFTAGIGEHAAPIREQVCRGAAWLGLEIDPAVNRQAAGPTRISTADSKVAAWVIPTNEEQMIARHTRRLLDPVNTGVPS